MFRSNVILDARLFPSSVTCSSIMRRSASSSVSSKSSSVSLSITSNAFIRRNYTSPLRLSIAHFSSFTRAAAPVKEVADSSEFKTALASDKVVIVDWFATWCGPCKVISPTFKKLSETHGSDNAAFFKVDVDEFPDLAQQAGIAAMPTFQVYKAGKLVAELRGASPGKLEELIKSHTA